MYRKPRWVIILQNLIHNVLARVRFAIGFTESKVGATHLSWDTDRSVAYINRVFSDYLEYGGLSSVKLAGSRVLELGPGDNLGVALRFHAAGAQHVTALDKFYSTRDAAQQESIYRRLRETLPASDLQRYDRAVAFEGDVSIDPECVHYVTGRAIENALDVLGRGQFDLIVSRAVLWEVDEIDRALEVLDHCLAPGGLMVHKIACLDWMFTQQGYHPLEFLTVPNWVYRSISKDSGKSNRRTIAHYRRLFEALGYNAAFHITRVVGSRAKEFPPGTFELTQGKHYHRGTLDLLGEIRPRLQPEFRELSDADLMVEDMFVVASKPLSNSGAIGARADAYS